MLGCDQLEDEFGKKLTEWSNCSFQSETINNIHLHPDEQRIADHLTEGSTLYGGADKDSSNTRFGLETILEEMRGQSEDSSICESRMHSDSGLGSLSEEYLMRLNSCSISANEFDNCYTSNESSECLDLLRQCSDSIEYQVSRDELNDLQSHKSGEMLSNYLHKVDSKIFNDCEKELGNSKLGVFRENRVQPNGTPSRYNCVVKENFHQKSLMAIVDEKCNLKFTRSLPVGRPNLEPLQLMSMFRPKTNLDLLAERIDGKTFNPSRRLWSGLDGCSSIRDLCQAMVQFIRCIQNVANNGSRNAGWTTFKITGELIYQSFSITNLIAGIIGLICGILCIGYIFYKPPGMIDYFLFFTPYSRRSPFQTFYDTIFFALYDFYLNFRN